MRIVPSHWAMAAAAVMTTLLATGCAGGMGGNYGLASWRPKLPWSKTPAADTELAAAEAMGVAMPSSQIAAVNPNAPLETAQAATNYGQLSPANVSGVAPASAVMADGSSSYGAYQAGGYGDASAPQYGAYAATPATGQYGAYGTAGAAPSYPAAQTGYGATGYGTTGSSTPAYGSTSPASYGQTGAPSYAAAPSGYGTSPAMTATPSMPSTQTPSYGATGYGTQPSTYGTQPATTVADARYSNTGSYPSTTSGSTNSYPSTSGAAPTSTYPSTSTGTSAGGYTSPGSTGYTPGATQYSPGQTGYQPDGVPAYQSPTPAYQSPAPAYQSPTTGGYPATYDTSSVSPAPYRPGSTSDYPAVSDASSASAEPAVYQATASSDGNDVTPATALTPPVASGVPAVGLQPAPANLQLSPTPSGTTYR